MDLNSYVWMAVFIVGIVGISCFTIGYYVARNVYRKSNNGDAS